MRVHAEGLRILFVCAASEDIGFGHLNRCLVLAETARNRGLKPDFLVFGDAIAKARVETKNFPCIFVKNFSEIMGCLRSIIGAQRDLIVADLLYPGVAEKVMLGELFQQLGDATLRILAIDTLGKDSIVSKYVQLPVDIVLSPYFLPHQSSFESSGWRFLGGAKYAILGLEYSNLPERKMRRCADRLLITCGGSDPGANTVKILIGLERITRDLVIRVVVGPFFSDDLRRDLEYLANISKHSIQLLDAPTTLLDEMLWCDLAISASGLTKYELAASSTPALLFSIDAYHEEINKPFIEIGTAINLDESLSPHCIEYEVISLLDNVELRTEISARGRLFVDGFGAQRIFDELEKGVF